MSSLLQSAMTARDRVASDPANGHAVRSTRWRRAREPVRRWWLACSARERQALTIAVTVVGIALLWWVLIAPALNTLQRVTAERESLERQVQFMRSANQEAARLRSAAVPSVEARRQNLETLTRRLGSGGQLNVQGDQVQVTLNRVNANALAQWLVDVRRAARVRVVELRLTQQPTPAGSAPTTGIVWSGSAVLSLSQ